MKTILAATDYSPTSLNAVNYAAELASQTRARLLLYHAFHVPVITSEAGTLVIPFEDLEKENAGKLNKIANNLRKKHGNKLEIDQLVQMGFVADTFKQVIKVKKIDLLVMGIKGTGKISEIVVGSTASDTAGRVECPVLIIPEKASFKKAKKILFASDNEKIEDTSNLKILREMVYIFKSKIFLLNIRNPDKLISSEKKKIFEVEKYFKGIEHSLDFVNNKYDDVVTGINEFAKEKDVDMITVISRKHTLLNRLFNETTTKKMAFHTNIPLLALHE
jgi:nucleotide-binding universal stress UspA family protein